MKKFTKSIDITASPTKVWDTLTGAETFTDWCSAFSEGCTFEGKWGKGETMKFLGPGPDGKVGGMVV